MSKAKGEGMGDGQDEVVYARELGCARMRMHYPKHNPCAARHLLCVGVHAVRCVRSIGVCTQVRRQDTKPSKALTSTSPPHHPSLHPQPEGKDPIQIRKQVRQTTILACYRQCQHFCKAVSHLPRAVGVFFGREPAPLPPSPMIIPKVCPNRCSTVSVAEYFG